MSVSLETSQSGGIGGHATPAVLGVSPRLDPESAFSIVTATPEAISRRFNEEDAVIGTVYDRLMAIHNGMPYTDRPDSVHLMLAPSDTSRFYPHPEACDPEDLKHMVGITRAFVRTPPTVSGHVRLAGYNIADPRAHKKPLEKGLQAQTWNNLHIHHLEVSPKEMQSDFDHLPPAEHEKARRVARRKSSDLMPHSVSLLARGVVRDAWGSSNTKLVVLDPQETPACIAPGSVTVDMSDVPDRQYAQCLRAWHSEYASMHRDVFECFVEEYGDTEQPYTLRDSADRRQRVEMMIERVLLRSSHTKHEEALFRRQMGHLAHRVQSESSIMQGRDASQRLKQAESLVWMLPAYSVGMHMHAGRELLTMRPALTTNGGVAETLGFCPIRDRAKVIDSASYDATHMGSARAFDQAVYAYEHT